MHRLNTLITVRFLGYEPSHHDAHSSDFVCPQRSCVVYFLAAIGSLEICPGEEERLIFFIASMSHDLRRWSSKLDLPRYTCLVSFIVPLPSFHLISQYESVFFTITIFANSKLYAVIEAKTPEEIFSVCFILFIPLILFVIAA